MNAPASIKPAADAVNPKHYKQHPSGIECIAVVRHMDFNLGNAVKYIWRAGLKSANPIEDLRKARWYLDDEIELRQGLLYSTERQDGLALDHARAHIASQDAIIEGQRATIARQAEDLAAARTRQAHAEVRLAIAEETLRAVGPSVMSIAAERFDQIRREGFTAENDRRYAQGELASAAAAYARHAGMTDIERNHPEPPPPMWPWGGSSWKPSTRQRDLVKAGALIVADLDRLSGYDPVARPKPAERRTCACAVCRLERAADGEHVQHPADGDAR